MELYRGLRAPKPPVAPFSRDFLFRYFLKKYYQFQGPKLTFLRQAPTGD